LAERRARTSPAPTPGSGAETFETITIDSHGDHRIAMAMALVGLRRGGIAIREPQVVAKSYPDFWRDLDALLAGGEA